MAGCRKCGAVWSAACLMGAMASNLVAQPLRWQSPGPFNDQYSSSMCMYNPDRGVVFAHDYYGNSWEWDGEVWTQVGHGGPQGYSLKPGAYDTSRRVCVFPGYGSAWEFDPDPHTTWYEFDGSTWRERRAPLGPVPRRGAGVCFDPLRGAVMMFGGVYTFRNSPSGYSILNDLWALRDGAWTLVSYGTIPRRSGATLAFDSGRGSLFVAGGGNDSYALPELWEFGTGWTQRAEQLPGSSWTFRDDPSRGGVGMLGSTSGPFDTAWTWTGAGWRGDTFANALPADLMFGNVAFDPQRDVDVRYGMTERRPNNLFLQASGVRERRDDRWQVVLGRPPMGRLGAAMAYDEARGVSVMLGGYTGGNDYLNPVFVPEPSTWTFDGRAWTERAVPGPAQRMSFGMAYDSARAVTVVFGGRQPPGDSTAFADTWEWDGSAWTQRATTGPSPRSRVAMAYDRARGRTVLFGGLFGSTFYNDTWEWDGAAWTRRPIAGPSPRGRHTMTYDESRHVVVLFGGLGPQAHFLNETWEYDGSAWTRRDAPGPAARANHAMVYDPDRRVTVMWGGTTGSANLLDTWEWDGASWTPRPESPLPMPRTSQAAAYDRARHVARTFGGTYYSDGTLSIGLPFDDSWTLGTDCPAPVIRTQPAPVVACNRGDASIAIGVEGSGLIRYQWRRGEPRRVIEGAVGPTLSLSGLSLADAGSYDCIVISDGDCFRRRIVSEPAIVSVCVADFDCDGALDLHDYSAFIAAYESGDPAADVNGDGFLDFFDHDAFVEQWETGCGV